MWRKEQITCDIVEPIFIISRRETPTGPWTKEVNLVSWNGKPAKLDIREWNEDHSRTGKGTTMTIEEGEQLVMALHNWYAERSR